MVLLVLKYYESGLTFKGKTYLKIAPDQKTCKTVEDFQESIILAQEDAELQTIKFEGPKRKYLTFLIEVDLQISQLQV